MCFIVLVFWEMLDKVKMRYSFPPVTLAKLKNLLCRSHHGRNSHLIIKIRNVNME